MGGGHEGLDLRQRLPWIPQHHLIRQPQHPEPQARQLRISLAVPLLGFRRIVHLAIDLQHKLLLVAVEVHDVVPDLMLPPELQAQELPIPQQLPHQLLGRRLKASQLPRVFDQCGNREAPAIMALTPGPSPRG